MFPLKDLLTRTRTHSEQQHTHTYTGTQPIHQKDLEGNALVSQLHL